MPPKLRVQKRLYYKIGEACRLIDIQPYVLRYWETEFPALSPAKSRSGQRVYNEKELAVIRRIKELLYDEGYTIAGAKKKLEGELASGTLGRVEPAEPEAAQDAAVGTETGEEAPDEAAGQLPLGASPAPPEPSGIPAAAPLAAAPAHLDTRAAERVETLRAGIERSLRAAREILALLDSKPPVK
ncbi:MAG TPA: MerR family transcriptional regulator [Thermoanaerobaculia bacterium]|nr:MerR family transcriptional regulator [Thermoanaerobaculia bacterium]